MITHKNSFKKLPIYPMFKMIHFHLTNQNIDFSEMDANADYVNMNILKAISSKNMPLLKVLLQVSIKAHKNIPTSDKFLNSPGRLYGHGYETAVTPLWYAADRGYIKVVELFVKYKDYIGNLDFKYKRKTAIDIATIYFGEYCGIVKMLKPLMIDDQEKKQKKIQKFIETTRTSGAKFALGFSSLDAKNLSVAKLYLLRHNWDIDAAVQSFFNDESTKVSRNL